MTKPLNILAAIAILIPVTGCMPVYQERVTQTAYVPSPKVRRCKAVSSMAYLNALSGLGGVNQTNSVNVQGSFNIEREETLNSFQQGQRAAQRSQEMDRRNRALALENAQRREVQKAAKEVKTYAFLDCMKKPVS